MKNIKMTEELLPFCECGECGRRVTKPGNRFILGHNTRGVPHTTPAQIDADENMRDVPLPPETCARMSVSHTGVPLSPEHCAATSAGKTDIPHTTEHIAANSKAHKESEAVKAETERQRGGLDLVWHHVAYDFGRPEALMVRITRKFHGQIHNPKGIPISKHGYSLID